jgi:transcriptional regulator with XRE-family HTH domain
MADKTPLKIAPDLFRWARENVGLPLQVAARRIGVKPEKLEEWEGKEALPTPRQLEKAADAYKRPVAMFFLPAPPDEPASRNPKAEFHLEATDCEFFYCTLSGAPCSRSPAVLPSSPVDSLIASF